VRNAVKLIAEGGRISVSGRIGDEGVIIEVADQCDGLAAAAAALICRTHSREARHYSRK
jgi:signal transduction histidine kinase